MQTEFVGSSGLICAILVYDGGEYVTIPPQLGVPRDDQMQGTPAEQLCELAGRTCYDSLGKGRPSFARYDNPDENGLITEGYHDHIAKVGHGSVWEHFNFTIDLPESFEFWKRRPGFFPGLLNRPGVFVTIMGQSVRLTANLRAAIEWENFGYDFGDSFAEAAIKVRANDVAPHIAKPYSKHYDAGDRLVRSSLIADPINDNERWVSIFISGSRGLSHELVRHGDFTAISQRSTRFVDESRSDWVEHPLTLQYMREHKYRPGAGYFEGAAIGDAKLAYGQIVNSLEPWLISRGVDKTSARKQARGAARGYLGNALYTELIFSASVAQWKRILRQRASVFADAEIREMACKALLSLQQSRYGDRFANWHLEKSPDGIGFVAIEEKEAT